MREIINTEAFAALDPAIFKDMFKKFAKIGTKVSNSL